MVCAVCVHLLVILFHFLSVFILDNHHTGLDFIKFHVNKKGNAHHRLIGWPVVAVVTKMAAAVKVVGSSEELSSVSSLVLSLPTVFLLEYETLNSKGT